MYASQQRPADLSTCSTDLHYEGGLRKIEYKATLMDAHGVNRGVVVVVETKQE